MTWSWNVTLLLVHIAGFSALFVLYPRAPDWIQKLVVGLLAAAFVIFAAYYALALAGMQAHWALKNVGYAVEHIAVLIFVFRIFLVDQEKRCLPSSSARSPSSPEF